MDICTIIAFFKYSASAGRLHHTNDFGNISNDGSFPGSAALAHFIYDDIPLTILLDDLIAGQCTKLCAAKSGAAAELTKVRVVRL
jgi:hypothetical protein